MFEDPLLRFGLHFGAWVIGIFQRRDKCWIGGVEAQGRGSFRDCPMIVADGDLASLVKTQRRAVCAVDQVVFDDDFARSLIEEDAIALGAAGIERDIVDEVVPENGARLPAERIDAPAV